MILVGKRFSGKFKYNAINMGVDINMHKYILSFFTILIWFTIVLIFTTNVLLRYNRLIYYIVTIILLIVPTEIIKRYIYKKKH